MEIYEKGLDQLKSLLGQPIGNYQCYAVAAEYSGILCGPDLGGGTYYDELDPIEDGDIYSAAEIGHAYKWKVYGWEVIDHPTYDKLQAGAILCFEPNTRLTDDFITADYYGHCAVIRGLENGRIQTYEQKGREEDGELVAEYDREYPGSEVISSVILPPDFSGEPTEWVHGQAPMDDENKEE